MRAQQKSCSRAILGGVFLTKEPIRSTFYNLYQTPSNSYPGAPQCSILLNIMNHQAQPGFYSRPGAREACGMVRSRSLEDGNEEDG